MKVTIKPQLPVSDTSGKFGDSVTTAITTQGQLERIRIPIFSGNKMDFQKWNAAFTSCVDETTLSPQFKCSVWRRVLLVRLLVQ